MKKLLLIISVTLMLVVGVLLMKPRQTSAQPQTDIHQNVDYTLISNADNALTIVVNPVISTTQPERMLTLTTIQQGVQALLTTTLTTMTQTAHLIEHQDNGVWLLNANLTVNGNLTLTLQPDEVKWLKLRSNASTTPPIVITHPNTICSTVATTTYAYDSFVALRVVSATLLISGTRITSWDTVSNTFDTDIYNGRSYVIARDAAKMNVINSDLSYLGSGDSESYGVSWRDDENVDLSKPILTKPSRVTGDVISSTFTYNYYGIYTYQAAHMLFRGNQFHHNIGYGFDPHDNSHDFIVEDNASFSNGNHGFIISRGCSNFVFRRNKAYNNSNPGDVKNAQGFMLDPGGKCSADPQIPAFNNLFTENQAWGNDGYGLRVISSYGNVIQNNLFTANLKGISLEEADSYSNTLKANQIVSNTSDGVFVLNDARNNLVEGNTINDNGQHGVYFKGAVGNRVISNTLAGNAQYGIRSSGSLTDTFKNTWQGNAIYSNALGGVSLPGTTNGGIKPPQVFLVSATLITGTTVPSATVELFSDVDNQGRFVEGLTTADAQGNFSFSKAQWQAKWITAIATDLSGNSSPFSKLPPRSRAYLPLVIKAQS